MICEMRASHLYNQKENFLPELDEKWRTDLAFLVDWTAHLNEFIMHLQGENQLICAMFQTITVFEIKFK